MGGALCPVVGRICMDFTTVDLAQVPGARAGDECVCLGRQGGKEIGIPLEPKQFGRIAVQTARSVIRQGIRDGEKDQMLVEAKAQIAELAKLNKELENRPHEVAVETVRDEEAIATAAKEAKEKAEEAAKKRIAALEKQLNKAENERAEAVKKAETAGQDTEKQLKAATAEAEKIRAELEEAQKKLKASSADVAKFGVWFTQVQNDFNRMMEALREVNERDPEIGEKLKRGAVTLLKNLLERMAPDAE